MSGECYQAEPIIGEPTIATNGRQSSRRVAVGLYFTAHADVCRCCVVYDVYGLNRLFADQSY